VNGNRDHLRCVYRAADSEVELLISQTEPVGPQAFGSVSIQDLRF